MKKVFAVIVMLGVLASGASAEVVGTLYSSVGGGPEIMPLSAYVLDAGLSASERSVKYYGSLAQMQLALSRGEIAAMSAPEFVGEYMLRNNPALTLRGFLLLKMPVALAFGFLEEKSELCARFSKAVQDMEAEGKIGILARDYISGPAAQNPPAVKFEEFGDAETITVALTGDMPPLDYVGADGEPAGFNTAILAEIGRRLHANIKTITVETGSRAPALKSGRADVVFWFQVFEGYDVQPDVPEGVITSTPYFGWNKVMLIGAKQ
ncbi:MAG: transporter substrate-binding domain-containing protein [Synergistaceae bacterium]|nr:transporter substrate-binding domain-containing protein [Synergistaceae bacterium]